MTVDIRYPSTTACVVAGIPKQRFNEAVAAKRYPCAPKVMKGGTRTFNRDDMVTLFAYARLIEQDIAASVAGEIACYVRLKLSESPDAQQVRVPRYKEREKGPKGNGASDSQKEGEEYSALVEMVFDVAGIRSEVEARLVEATGGKADG